MVFSKEYNNGLRLVINKMDGVLSVSCGILVKTGSMNENDSENGISHFIEHTMFKGTDKRSAFEISDYIDRIGAQINAFTSKETTCYYTKSTNDHLEDSLEVLSDIFFNSTFKSEELEKEKGVIIEEINMSEDTPEDLCLDLLSESVYGKENLGRTILGPEKNIKRFTKTDVDKYMDKYYTAKNVVISIAGNVDIDRAENLCKKYFAEKFFRVKGEKQVKSKFIKPQSLYKQKKIEQSHIGISMKGICVSDDRGDALNIANTVLGGGMSSRLFQKIREELGLCYNIYSYFSRYKDSGVVEIYAGVNTEQRDLALDKIIDEIKAFKVGITENEFLRGKEQIKSSFVLGQESTASQMLLYGKSLLFLDEEFSFKDRLDKINAVKLKDVNEIIEGIFSTNEFGLSTVGPKRSKLKI